LSGEIRRAERHHQSPHAYAMRSPASTPERHPGHVSGPGSPTANEQTKSYMDGLPPGSIYYATECQVGAESMSQRDDPGTFRRDGLADRVTS